MSAKLKYTLNISQSSERRVLQISERKERELLDLFQSRTSQDRMTFETFLTDLWEMYLVDFRLQNRKPKTLAPEPLFRETAENRVSTHPHRRGVSGETAQKILFLSGTMSIKDIARRFGMGESTVGRILRAHQQRETRTRTDIGHCRTRRPRVGSRAFPIGASYD